MKLILFYKKLKTNTTSKRCGNEKLEINLTKNQHKKIDTTINFIFLGKTLHTMETYKTVKR